MRTITQNVYTVAELNASAKQEAYYNWIRNHDYHWADENRKTLDAFEKIFPITVRNWEYDSMHGHVSFDFDEDECIADLTGIRLMKYLYNNYWNQITKGKYYSTVGHWVDGNYSYKHRYSKVMITEPSTGACPLTGYWVDDDILEPIFDFLKKPNEYTTFEDLMRDCLNAWVNACVSDFEACSSMEYFMEYAEINGYEFYEDGRVA